MHGRVGAAPGGTEGGARGKSRDAEEKECTETSAGMHAKRGVSVERAGMHGRRGAQSGQRGAHQGCAGNGVQRRPIGECSRGRGGAAHRDTRKGGAGGPGALPLLPVAARRCPSCRGGRLRGGRSRPAPLPAGINPGRERRLQEPPRRAGRGARAGAGLLRGCKMSLGTATPGKGLGQPGWAP